MSKPRAFPALAQFVAATAGRNMTKAGYVAVAAGVVMMVLLTVDPAYETAHHWVDAVLWTCLAFFMFEWVVRLRHAYLAQHGWTYAASGRGLLDAVSAEGDSTNLYFERRWSASGPSSVERRSVFSREKLEDSILCPLG